MIEALRVSPAQTIPDVLDRMRAIAAALPPADGIACFNHLYLGVTENVAARVGRGYFADDAAMARMDVVFANHYFAALRAFADDASSAPRSWAPLFEARSDTRIAPLAFALAGMNAHINHDLGCTVFELAVADGAPPIRGSVAHADYLRINEVLGATIDDAKAALLPRDPAGIVAAVDAVMGRTDDAVALFSVAQAREAAWTSGETRWVLRAMPALAATYEASVDRMVGMASRAMLTVAHGSV